MARFDIHRARGEPGYLLNCQSDLLDYLNTRLVVPLRQPHQAPVPAARLNPFFEIGGVKHVMVTQFASAMPVRDLGSPVASLLSEQDAIMNALDMLLTGI